MLFAGISSFLVGTAKLRHAAGPVALVAGFVIVGTALIGGAWALAASWQALPDVQSNAASRPTFDLAGSFALVSPGPKFDLAGTFALLDEKPGDAPRPAPRRPVDSTAFDFTWSSYRLAALDDVAGSLSSLRSRSDEMARASRQRMRLASLTPLDGTSAQPDEDNLEGRTAIYDIAAKTLYMPNGEQFEAHSGFGEMMDDPANVHHRMLGATPPNTYNLKLRESTFHGVQAVRMLPVNDKAMFGRTGILVHPFMLGPNGQSNGCISLRDYAKFLQAFQRGEVARIVVVPNLPRKPTLAARLFNML